MADADPKTVLIRGASLPRVAPSIEVPEQRYDLGDHLASGGQGDVYRVFDKQLRRKMVMKLLAKEWIGDPMSLARFIQEAQVTAQLQHPSIVPVHEIGTLGDGTPYYTMAEVRGRTLQSVIEAVHAASAELWCEEPGGYGLRRLIDTFHRVCEAVGYAHSRGVVHRDLKPLNIMVGEFGEALVLDWGLARLRDGPSLDAPTPSTSRREDISLVSVAGAVAGTVGYMAPEQASGEAEIGPPADVYALGMILREILTGATPGFAEMMGLDVAIVVSPRRPVSDELVAICARAVEQDIASRYPDAIALAKAVGGFLDGARKRERALELLASARALGPRIAELQDRAATLEQEARGVLDPLPPFTDAAVKEPGWDLEDQARVLRIEADLVTHEMTGLVESSLVEAELPAAHALLARHYRTLHAAAELAGDPSTRKLELQLRAHDRGEHAAYLAGDGALTLHTEPPAQLELRRYELRGRRLVDEHVRHLGLAPVQAIELPRGSYLLVLRAPGHHEVRYPVAIGRQEHWDPRRPGTTTPHAVTMPPLGAIGDDEIYVPAGPFTCGGDPQAAGEVMKRQRVWVDSFVIRRHSLTNAQILEMVNDAVDAGHEELALSVVPRHRGTSVGELGTLVWPRDDRGHFSLGAGDDEGMVWEPDAPAFMITWHGAMTYAAWLAQRTGQPYRLVGELEREKAGRGVDGRAFPWGDFFDPTWACMRLSQDGLLRPARVDRFPVDESPYGVRHLAGNVVEWCADEYLREGPPLPGGIYTAPRGLTADDAPCERTLRGGCFLFDSFLLRGATRHNSPSIIRDVTLGFRLARSYPT